MKISVIVPTVSSRAAWLKACLAAYQATTPNVELIVIHDRDYCGQAWIAGAEQATGDYLHFTADDLLPLPGWWEAAVEVADAGGIPGANVLTARGSDGEWLEDSTMFAGSYLLGGRDVRNVLVPFLTREVLDQDEWLLPIHYGSDDWVTFLADRHEIPTPFTAGYRLGHGAAPEGRLWDSRKHDIPLLCEKMAAHGTVPWPYQQMGMDNGWSPETSQVVAA